MFPWDSFLGSWTWVYIQPLSAAASSSLEAPSLMMNCWQFSFLGGTHVAHRETSHASWKYKLAQHSLPLSAPTKQLLFFHLLHLLSRSQTSVYVPLIFLGVTHLPVFGIFQSQSPERWPWSASLGELLETAHPCPWAEGGVGNYSSQHLSPKKLLNQPLFKSSFYPVLYLWFCGRSAHHGPGSLHSLCEFLHEACLLGGPASHLPWNPDN